MLCNDYYLFFFFFFNDTATTEIYTLSLHDALPITSRSTTRRCSTRRTSSSTPATRSRARIPTCSSSAPRAAPRRDRRPSSPERDGPFDTMLTLFWISAAIVGYVYIGYPCLLALWARVADRRARRAPFAPGQWPSISIVIAARNEAVRLPDRVRNLLEQAYPGP